MIFFAVRYYRKLPKELREIEEKLRPMMQFQPHPIAHDLMLQGLGVQMELHKKIAKLKEYRRNGIITSRGRMWLGLQSYKVCSNVFDKRVTNS